MNTASIKSNNYMPITEHAEYVEVEPNVKLHITDSGRGRPIVMIHGWPLSDEMYEYQYRELTENNFRVIGITLRGFGKSDKPFGENNYDIHAMDIKKVFSRLKLKNAVLVGFSMGGGIAVRYASMDDGAHVAKLALISAAVPVWTQDFNHPYNISKENVDEMIELCHNDRPMLLANFAKLFSATETSLNYGIRHWLTTISMSASPHATAQCLLALRDTDLREDLPKIRIPTVIMHGKLDKICSYELAEQMRLGIINSHVIPFEYSGHSLFLEEKYKFNAELIKFANV